MLVFHKWYEVITTERMVASHGSNQMDQLFSILRQYGLLPNKIYDIVDFWLLHEMHFAIQQISRGNTFCFHNVNIYIGKTIFVFVKYAFDWTGWMTPHFAEICGHKKILSTICMDMPMWHKKTTLLEQQFQTFHNFLQKEPF